MSTIYETLGIPPEASLRDIKRAYAGLIKRCDQENDPGRFQEIRTAYEIATQIAKQRESEADEANFATPPLAIEHEVAPPPAPQPSTMDHDGADRPAPPEAPIAATDEAQEALAALIAEHETNPQADPEALLKKHLESSQLIALGTRERFEQQLLTWIFEPTLKVDWLDAATRQLSWETAYRHLQEYRPDLTWRMRRQSDLVHLIATTPGMDKALIYGDNYNLHGNRATPHRLHHYNMLQDLAKALNTLQATFPAEARERYGDKLDYWESLMLPPEPQPVPRAVPAKPQRQGFSIPPILVVALVLTIFRAAPDLLDSFSFPQLSSPSAPTQKQLPPSTSEHAQSKCDLSEAELKDFVFGLHPTNKIDRQIIEISCQKEIAQKRAALMAEGQRFLHNKPTPQ